MANQTRRSFMASTTAAAVAAFFAPPASLARAQAVATNAYTRRLATGHLVANVRTGTIHHSEICSDCLPAPHNRDLDYERYLHPMTPAMRCFNVHEALAVRSVLLGKDAASIVHFRNAIRHCPTQVHLYDRMNKVLGRLKRYDEILELYTWGHAHVKEALAQQPRSRKLRWANQELASRLERTRRRRAVEEKVEVVTKKFNTSQFLGGNSYL